MSYCLIFVPFHRVRVHLRTGLRSDYHNFIRLWKGSNLSGWGLIVGVLSVTNGSTGCDNSRTSPSHHCTPSLLREIFKENYQYPQLYKNPIWVQRGTLYSYNY